MKWREEGEGVEERGRGQAGRGEVAGGGSGLADIDVPQLVGFVTADCLLDVGKAGTMVQICEARRERLVGWLG